jgi:hypothetical protein
MAGGRLDAGKTEHEARGAVAGDCVVAVEQIDLDGAGARGCHGEGPQDLHAQVLGDMRGAQGPAEAFAGHADFLRGVLIFVLSPLTSRSIAARTFLVIRIAEMGSAGAGVSSAARARLAGVMSSVVATVGRSRPAATHRRVTFCVSPTLIEWFCNQILRYTFNISSERMPIFCLTCTQTEKRDVR